MCLKDRDILELVMEASRMLITVEVDMIKVRCSIEKKNK